MRPEVPKLLVWDNAPPHHPKRVQAVAEAAHIHLVFLPFRAPELMPCEDLWRLTKAVVAANRTYPAVQEQAERALAWLTALTPFDRLLKTGLFGTKFQWLSTCELATAIVFTCFGLIGLFVLIGAHKDAATTALFGSSITLLGLSFMGLLAGAMWLVYRRALWNLQFRMSNGSSTNTAPPTPSL